MKVSEKASKSSLSNHGHLWALSCNEESQNSQVRDLESEEETIISHQSPRIQQFHLKQGKSRLDAKTLQVTQVRDFNRWD